MNLTGVRRLVLIVWLVAVVSLCVFVPWGRPATYGRTYDAGYAPIWTGGPSGHDRTVVDTNRLFIELVAVTAAAGLALALFPTRRDGETLREA